MTTVPKTMGRVAMVGTRHWHSQAFQQTLADVRGAEVVAILDDGGAVISALQAVPRYQSLEELLKVSFEAAIVTVPANEAPNCALQFGCCG